MRKIFIALLAGLSVLGLASCGGDSTKKIRITYSGWDVGNDAKPEMINKLVEEFNAQSTEYTVIAEFLPNPVQTTLNNYALNESMPDIFLIDSVPVAVAKEWALDLTPYVTADPEWANVDSNMKKAISYDDGAGYEGVFALPSAQHFKGFFVNYDVVNLYASHLSGKEAQQVFYGGSEDFTKDLFFQTIKDVKYIADDSSIIGVNATGDMINWLPSVIEDSTRDFVWDEGKQEFDYNSEVIIEALTQINALGNKQDKYTFNSYQDPLAEEDPRIGLFGTTEPSEAFLAGRFGFYQGMTSDKVSEIDFNYKFIGYPNKRVVSVGDFLCISKYSKNPDAAYEVAKFLSFGSAGINARYKIVDENPEMSLTGLPINVDKTLTDKWFDYVAMEGVEEIYRKALNGEIKVILEGLKTTPGYVNARYYADTGVIVPGVRNDMSLTIGDLIWDVCEGSIDVGTYISVMTNDKKQALNEEVQLALDKIKAVVAKTRPQEQPQE